MDTPWKSLRDRFDRGIDLSQATDKDISDYVEAKAIIYEGEELCDTELWEVFKIEFRHFTSETFARANPIANLRLRSCLQRGGVYVALTRGSDEYSTAYAISEVIKEKDNQQWTIGHVEAIRPSLEGSQFVFSRALARSGLLKDFDVHYATNCVNITSPAMLTSKINVPLNRPQNLPTLTPESQTCPLPNSLPPTVVEDIQPQH